MKNKFSILIFLFSFLTFVQSSLSYSTHNTHPVLTEEIVKFFNTKSQNYKFSQEEVEWLKQGSIREDEPARWINHFYDPINKTGWSGKHWGYLSSEEGLAKGESLAPRKVLASIDWAVNQEYQSAYSMQYGNQTWQKALNSYLNNDKKSALLALGHILHLIEDLSVPDHTRDDTHAGLYGDPGSPYEEYARNYTSYNKLNIAEDLNNQNQNFLNFNSLQQYFNDLALYSNQNFFSEDTINNEEYNKPNINNNIDLLQKLIDDSTVRKYLYYNEIYLTYIKTEDPFTGKKIFSTDDESFVLPSYRSHLFPLVVLTGASVINQFFKEVEYYKQNPHLLEPILPDKNQPIIQTLKTAPKLVLVKGADIIDGLKTSTEVFLVKNFDRVKNLFTKSEPSPALVLIQPQEETKSAEENLVPQINIQPSAPTISQLPQQGGQTSLEMAIPSNEPVAVPKAASEPEPIKPENAVVSLSPEPKETQGGQTSFLASKPLADSFGLFAVSTGAGFGGGGEAAAANSQNNNPVPPSDTAPPEVPLITSPSDFNSVFATTTIVFQGTAKANSTIQAAYLLNSATTTATTSVSGLGNWSIALNLNQASTTIDFYAIDGAGNVSSANRVSFFVDSLAPEISSFSISECANSLSSDGCLIATTTLRFSWNSSSSDLDYYEFSYGSNVSTTTATSTILTLGDWSGYTFSLRARDKNSNWSSATTTSAEIATLPVVINEVAWAGTAASSSDEWIELYNNTSKTINLNNFVLYSSTDLSPYINLTNSIASSSHYLLERGSDDLAVSDTFADWKGSFGYGLNNNGETLVLAYVSNGATTTLDATAVHPNGSWPAGSVYISMERINQQSAGNLTNNWTGNNQLIKNGKNSANNSINGTPKARNSADYLIASGQINITSDAMLKKSKSPYLVNHNIQVFQGNAVLTIEPGVVIKFYNDAGFNISGNAKIIAQGTASKPIVFTSFYDDAYSGDTNGDAASTLPSGGDWYGVKIDSTNTGSVFENAIFRYGGKYYTASGNTMANLSIENTSVSIASSTLEYSKIYGLKLVNSSSTVSNNIFRFNNQQNDTAGYSSAVLAIGGSPTIQSNTFSNNRRGLHLGNSGASVVSNIFNSNTNEAVYSSGRLSDFANNSGSGNAINAITLEGNLTQANSTSTLKSNSLPYYLWGYNSPTIVASSTLTIEPNVVLKASKLTYTSRFNVYGNLLISGSSSSDVVFTSVYDDSIGGDLTNNGTTTQPAKNDWEGITLYSASYSNIRGTTLSYANTALNYQSSPINLSNIRFSNNNLGVQADAGSIVQSAASATIEFFNNTATTSPAGLW